MLHDSKLPQFEVFLWGEALMYSVFVKNWTWTQSLGNATPYELLTGSKLDLSNMNVWGSRVWVHSDGGTKLDGRAKEGWWVGFDDESKDIRFIGKESGQ